jgi:ankyrin repeat protein
MFCLRLNPTGNTALHVAVWLNNLPIVEHLLKEGASVLIQDAESQW